MKLPPSAILEHHRESDPVTYSLAGEVRTASRFRSDVHRLVEALHGLPARTGSEIIVACRDRYHFAAAVVAAWQCGHAVALPPNVAPQTIASLRRSGAVRTVMHDVDGTPGIDLRTVVSSAGGSAEQISDEHGASGPDLRFATLSRVPPDRLLARVYTSGSTGTPTECPKTAGQLLGETQTLSQAFAPPRGARFLATVPPHHIYGLLFGVLLPLTTGGAFLRDSVLHAEPLADAITRHDVGWLVSVPAHLRSLRVLDPGQMPVLDRVFSSGAALPRETALDLMHRFSWRITEVLGSSETGGIASRDDPDSDWMPLPGVSVGQGEDQRMVVDSPFLSPEAERPFPTGDRIAITDSPRFRHLGRADGVLKVGATRISIAELEAKILAIDGVSDVAVMAVDVGGARGTETWAAVASERHSSAEIRALLLPWLEPVVIPRRIRVMPSLPRESTGKLTRQALSELFQTAAQAPKRT